MLKFKYHSFLSLFSLIIILPYSQNFQQEIPQEKSALGFNLRIANGIFEKGEQLFQEARYDSAITTFKYAGVLYKKEENFDKYVQCFNYIGDSYRRLGEYDKAMEHLSAALSIGSEKLGDRHLTAAISYHNIGNVHRIKGDYDRAFDFFNQSLSIRLENQGREHSDVAKIYTDMCILHFHKGNHEKALELAHGSLAIKLKSLGEQHPDVAKSYNLIGIFYFERGDYDKALEYYNKCLSIRLVTLGDNHPGVAGTYNNIGIVHFYKKEYAKALDIYNKSLSIRKQTYQGSHHTIAASYNNIGIVYKNIGEYDKALEYLNKSLSIRLQSLGKNHPKLVYSYHEIGSIYREQRKFDKALDILNESLRIRLKIFGKRHPLVSEIYQEIGKVYEKQNELNKALRNYQKSIIALFPDFNEKDIRVNPTLKNMSSEPFLLTSLKLKGEALEKRFSHRTHQLGDLYLSIATFELASDLIDQLRCGYKAEGSKYLLGDQALEIYKKAVETTLELYKLTKDRKLLEKAFTFAEKGKAGVLRQALSENKAKQFAGIPDDLLESERQLKMDLAFYEQAIFDEASKKEDADSSQIVLWKDKLFTYKQNYEALMHQFEEEFPNYYNLKYQVNTVSSHQIQEKILADKTVLIEYFIADSSLIVFTMDRNNFDVTVVRKPPDFENQVESLRTGLIERNYSAYTANSHALYNVLIQPLLPKIKGKDLIIVPDGILGYISFETLITEAAPANKEDYRKLYYLIDDFQMAYSYSATLFFENMTAHRMQRHGNYIGFAPVFFN